MKGMLQRLRIIESDENTEAPDDAAEEKKGAVTPSASKRPRTAPISVRPKAAEPDQAMYSDVRAAVFAADTDLTRFLNQLTKLSSVITDDEAKLYLAAATVAGKSGADILKAIGLHTQALEREKAKLVKAQAAQRETVVGAREKQLAEVAGSIEEKNREIERLNADIATLTEKHSTIEREIADETAVIDVVSSKFEVVYAALEAEIEAEKSKIKAYLKGGGA